MMEFLILLYWESWSWELEHLAFLNIRSLLAMPLLMSLVIQVVADLIGTCLVGMEQFMASRKTVSSCLAKVQSAFPYSQIFLVGGLVSLGGALNFVQRMVSPLSHTLGKPILRCWISGNTQLLTPPRRLYGSNWGTPRKVSRLGHPSLLGNKPNMGPGVMDQGLIQCLRSRATLGRKRSDTLQHARTGGIPRGIVELFLDTTTDWVLVV